MEKKKEKILYVHIGTAKTGTSAIQWFLINNREILEKNGYIYPDLGYYYKGKGRNRNGVFLTSVWRDGNGDRNEEEEKRILKEGLQKVEALFSKHDKIILSDEMIWHSASKRRETIWQELKDAADQGGYTVKIIVYLRKQGDYAISQWNEDIKKAFLSKWDDVSISKYMKTWDEYLTNENRVNFHYYRTLKKAADVLGQENIIVRRYGRKYLKDGLTQVDFLDVLGLELTDEYVIQDSLVNTKLSLNCCEMKRVINGVVLDNKERAFLRDVLLEISPASEKDYPCVLWTAEQEREFMEAYREENDKVAEMFIHDGQPLFDDDAKDGEVWSKDNPHMMDDLVRFVAASNVALLREINAQRGIVNLIYKKLKHPVKAASGVLRRKMGGGK